MTKKPDICVLGGGTAGCMAAAHISRKFPNLPLTHVFDSRLPTIGVGEGTTPPFRAWIHEIIGLTFADLQRRGFVTVKEGIRFENWGRRHAVYHHLFGVSEGHAYHISADRISEILRESSRAERLDRRVIDIKSNGKRSIVRFEDGTDMAFDLVVDARGFPSALDDRHTAFEIIPTNAALLQRCRNISDLPTTRAVARPFGWIFCIPLSRHTSCGYIFNSTLNSPDEIREDLAAFLDEQCLDPAADSRLLAFPNFVRNRIFDGSHFHIGNAASFLEPLEATAITVILFQLRLISAWLVTRLTDWGDDDCAMILDRQCAEFVEQVGWFVGWHYARGSVHDTEFWRRARRNLESACKRAADRPTFRGFQAFVDAAKEMDPGLALATSRDEIGRLKFGDNVNEVFGGFIMESFAKVGHGIGYYS